MTPTVRTVTPETSACAVAQLFADHDFGFNFIDIILRCMVGIVYT